MRGEGCRLKAVDRKDSREVNGSVPPGIQEVQDDSMAPTALPAIFKRTRIFSL